MTCPYCHKEIDEGSKFCGECGEAISFPGKPPAPEPVKRKPGFWISGLSFIASLHSIIIVISGIIGGIMISSASKTPILGVLVVAISLIYAFISVAATMILLNVAEDVQDIRRYITRR